MNVIWEAMIDEMRLVRLELDTRRHFTEERQPIELARDFVAAWTGTAEVENPAVGAAHTANSLSLAAAQNLVEVG